MIEISVCLFFGFFGLKEKCYEPLHLRYYNIGEAWGRIHLRNVEQCVCSSDGVSCMRTRYRGSAFVIPYIHTPTVSRISDQIFLHLFLCLSL